MPLTKQQLKAYIESGEATPISNILGGGPLLAQQIREFTWLSWVTRGTSTVKWHEAELGPAHLTPEQAMALWHAYLTLVGLGHVIGTTDYPH